MTVGGWIFMLLSVSFVLGLAGFCFYHILTLATTRRQSDVESEHSSQESDQQQHSRTTAGT